MRTYLTRLVSALIAATAAACVPLGETEEKAPGPLQPLTVAFIADQGLKKGAREVLQLIKAEGADLVLHQGDLDYRDDPRRWDDFITSILGRDFPYFASIGNHDVEFWYGRNGYQSKLRARLNRIPEATCRGDLGVRSSCTFGGLFFILSGAGTLPDKPDDPDHVAYIRKQLARTGAIWRFCSWHKNQTLMQTGRKGNEVGWGPYEACREGGAIIATAHNHAYSRTYLMDDLRTQSIASTSETMTIEKGRTFVFVSGLGGRPGHKQVRGGPWWAAVHSLDQGGNLGALFCNFFMNANPNQADCYFKGVDGNISDRFDLISNVIDRE